MLRTVPERLPSVHRSSFPPDIRPDSKPDLHGGTMPELLRSKASASALPNPEFPTVPDCSTAAGKSTADYGHSWSGSFWFHRRWAAHTVRPRLPFSPPWCGLPFRCSPVPEIPAHISPPTRPPAGCSCQWTAAWRFRIPATVPARQQLPAVSHR